MMRFVTVFQSTQNGNRIFHTGFFYHYFLKTTLQGFIFLKVLLVFIQRGGANGAKLSTGQGRLQNISSIHSTFTAATGTHQGMNLIDKQDDLPIAFGYFFYHIFQTLFKFTFILCTRNQLTHIEGINHFRF